MYRNPRETTYGITVVASKGKACTVVLAVIVTVAWF